MVYPVFGLVCGLVCLSLTGCASGTGAEWDTLASAIRGDFAADKVQRLPPNPNPAFRYLRVELGGFPAAMLALGYVDAHPQGPVEVWYSAQGEVLKVQNGRIVATAGLPLDWVSVQFTPAPQPWAEVAVQGVAFSRVRSELPSYRFAIAEQVKVMPVPGLKETDLPFALPASLARENVPRYQWFRESSSSSSNSAASGVGAPLPDSWFAIGKHMGQTMVVYSRQCLTPGYCLHLQRWPVQEDAL